MRGDPDRTTMCGDGWGGDPDQGLMNGRERNADAADGLVSGATTCLCAWHAWTWSLHHAATAQAWRSRDCRSQIVDDVCQLASGAFANRRSR